jgi:hypothetical protein
MQADDIRGNILELSEMLEASAPGLPTKLKEIHKKLKADPDVVTILSNEEVSIIVQGLKKQTKTEIATTALKKRGTKKAMKNFVAGVDL